MTTKEAVATTTTHIPTPFYLFPLSALPSHSHHPVLTRITLPTNHNYKEFNHYGTFDAAILASRTAEFIAANTDGGNDAAQLHATLLAFLTLAEADTLRYVAPPDRPRFTRACWLTVRLHRPTDDYVLPRWHQDGRMFPCRCAAPVEDLHCKYGVTLLGPATRVLEWSDLVEEVLRDERGSDAEQDDRREAIAERFRAGGCREVEVMMGQVIRFSWGTTKAPVHSEPDMSASGDRVFVTLLFGSEEEIRLMCEWRGKGFVQL
ncbi:hypothetical protein VTK56DRAFT_2066 [Thermocarpiscus australiensis]